MQKLHSWYWFIAINSLFAMLISTRYFSYMPELPSGFVGLSFVVTSIFSQMFLLSLIIGLISLPCFWLSGKTSKLLIAFIASVGLSALIIDTFVFAQYRFHINAIVLDLVLSGDVVSFPLITWVMAGFGLLALFVTEYLIVKQVMKFSYTKNKKMIRKTTGLLVVCLLVSHGIHIWAAANVYQPVTMVKRYLPLFYPTTSNSLMKKYGWINEEAIAQEKQMKVSIKGDIQYPLTPIQSHKPDQLKNIVFVVIDSWRFDTFNEKNTPNIWELSKQGVRFENHLSTGNATRTGIFGLFYGLHGTYWHSFLANKQSPLLIQRMQSLDYQLGIFAAASLAKPEFSQTVFKDIDNLRMRSEGKSPSEKDRNLTNDWLDWFAQKPQDKPSFSFLFYDAPHGYDFPKQYPSHYLPMDKNVNYLALNNDYDEQLLFNRYKNSVHYVDSLIAEVVDSIKQAGEMENTVIIITSDHGQEMNDNKLNYWGHNSNFTDVQVKVPFIVVDLQGESKQMTQNVNQLTSHFDVAPTIMHNYLGVDSPVSDYSVGIDLYKKQQPRSWILSSNYSGYAIIDDKKIVEVTATGQYQLLDKRNRVNKQLDINYKHVQEALLEMSRFSK